MGIALGVLKIAVAAVAVAGSVAGHCSEALIEDSDY